MQELLSKSHSLQMTLYTLILDGSRCSLQAALDVLEIFGSISGLSMNSDKTKVIWIGCKKHSGSIKQSNRVKHLVIILKFCNIVFGIILNCQEKLSFFQNGTIRGFY